MLSWLLGLAVAAPLALDDVLAAVDARVPQLAAVEAKLDEAEAKLLASRGAFDPILTAKVGAYGGKDPRDLARVGVTVPTSVGPGLDVGWALGRGQFPPYATDDETGPGGELRVRAFVPLLDGLGLSPERARQLVASAGVDLAVAELDDRRVQIRRKASEAYWKWTAIGAKLQIERALLRQAEARAAALERQVTEGTRARIDQLDNERALLLRRDAVARGERDLALAALALSLWYRDVGGAPIVPSAEALGELSPGARPPAEDEDRTVISRRPDARVADALLAAARIERARAGNGLLPDLVVSGEAIRPVDPDRKPELYAGVELKLPTLLRRDRGARQGADAVVERLEATRRSTLDAATAEVEAARVAIDTAWQRVDWTQLAQERAAEVVALERRRFDLGSGDVFQLLARERNLAEAQKGAVEARFDLQLGRAAREAALGRLP